jgi:hypothetical protein
MPWRKFVAMSMMVIMLAAAFSMMVPAAKNLVQAPAEEENPAHTQGDGVYDATYTFSDFGDSFLKVSDDTSLGQLAGASGVNQWWYDRWFIGPYDDFVIRDKAPFVLMYGPYGYNPTSLGMLKAGYFMWTFYRMDVVATDLTSIQTGANDDPLLIPILKGGTNPQQYDGGWVNISWHMTYLSEAECTAIDAGTHYANSYYGLPAGMGGDGTSGFQGGYDNDGWWNEISGKMDFSRNAADKFLGLDGTAPSLIDEFNTKNAGNAIGTLWQDDWEFEGSAAGPYDVYCSYLFSIDPVVCWLTLNDESTDDKLVLNMWVHSWGAEALMLRYLDVTGVLPDWNYVWPEGLWLNATMGPDSSDVTLNGYVQYNMGAWKDMNPVAAIKEAAWLIEPMHSDYVNDTTAHPLWTSQFRLYAPSNKYKPTKENWMPGTLNWGNRVAYWYTPRNFNLSDGEKIVIELSDSMWGVKPYKGASDAIGQLKANEIYSNGVWGEMVLGHTVPIDLYDLSYYDPASKTMTLEGPLGFAWNGNKLFPKLNETGTPLVPLAISRVSSYTIELEAQAEYLPGVPYALTITCLNYTGAAAAGFYHNVTLSSDIAGTVFDETTHAFLPGDTNVWDTHVTFGDFASAGHIVATSGEFPLDVSSQITIVVVPEFPLMLLPVMGAAVAVVVLLRRRNK